MSHFNAVDAAAVFIVLWSLVAGARKGLFIELPRLVNAAIVLLTALLLYLPFGNLLVANTRFQNDPEQARALAFMLIVVISGLCLLVLRLLFQLAMKIVFTPGKRRLGGGIVGLARGVICVFVLVFGISLWPHHGLRKMVVETSFVGRSVSAVSPPIMEYVRRVPAWTGPPDARSRDD